MLQLIKHSWRGLIAAATLLGILAIPADTFSAPEAARSWLKVFAMIDQKTALLIFSFILLVYVIWTDIRPFVDKWRRGERREVSIGPNIVWGSAVFKGLDGTDYFRNTAYLVVYNNGRSKRTALEARASAYLLSGPIPLLLESGASQVDLHHGEVAKFLIGHVVTKQSYGASLRHIAEPSEADLLYAKHNLPNGNFNFQMGSNLSIAISASGRSAMKHLLVRVSARDVPTVDVRFDMDVALLAENGGITTGNAMSITSINPA